MQDETESRQQGEREPMAPEAGRAARWPTVAVMAISFLAIMGPLALVLIRFGEAEDRLDQQAESVCSLAISNEHLAETLDRGLALLLADDAAEAEARAALTRTVTDGLASAEAAKEEC